jgi:hypothetical protein
LSRQGIRKKIAFASVCWTATGVFAAAFGAWLNKGVPTAQCPVSSAGATTLVPCNSMGLVMIVGGIFALLVGVVIYASRRRIELVSRRLGMR